MNKDGENNIKVLIFEGWCVGFRPLPADELRRKWETALREKDAGSYNGRLGWNSYSSIEFINNALGAYEALTT